MRIEILASRPGLALFFAAAVALGCSGAPALPDAQGGVDAGGAMDAGAAADAGSSASPDGGSTASSGCGRAVNPDPDGDGDPLLGSRSAPLTVQALGRTREFAIRLPQAYAPSRRYPVVLFFHGDSNLAQLPKGLDGRGFFGAEPLLGDDAIIVYLDGENLHLAGRDPGATQSLYYSWDDSTPPPNNPDIAYVDAVLAQLRSDYCVDTAKTFAVGFSGGGYFVNTLACFRGGLSAIALFQAGFEDGSLPPAPAIDRSTCVTPAPAALVVHTPQDTTVPEAAGLDALAHWRTANGCSATGATSPLQAACTDLGGCGGRVTHCRPACAIDLEPDGTCDGDQHTVWQPHGPTVMSGFLRRFF